jgi:hypothetical protein
MPLPKVPPAQLDAPHSFVISLADPKPLPQVIAPLPAAQSSAEATAHGPRTQVLAKNEGLAWSQNIGEDAEILAIAKAMGTAPGQGRRSVLMAAGVGVVALIVVGALFGGEIRAMLDRALTGKSQEVGAIVIKIRPSPDAIELDGKSRGAGNKKITNVDINTPHRLVVKPKGMDPIVRELTRADFAAADNGVPTFAMEKDFLAPTTP